MKKIELYKIFSHYEALSKDNSTTEQRIEIYRLMQNSGITVPEDVDIRRMKGKFPFNCDFFISKHPTAHIIKWVPTRSADKKGKFIYKDVDYFLKVLQGIPVLTGVAVDPTNNILAEQAKHVGAVLIKVSMKRASENTTLEMLMNDAALEGEIIDADTITITVIPGMTDMSTMFSGAHPFPVTSEEAHVPTPLEINEDPGLPF